MIKESMIRQQLGSTLEKTNFTGLGTLYTGKVRDNYSQPAGAGAKGTAGKTGKSDKPGRRIIITSDRISAFDVVLGTIPFKGQVLNQMAQFWFENTGSIIRNHSIAYPDPNVMVVEECEALPVEMIVRGYITGVTTTSAWHNYSKGVRNFCGNILPEGMKKDLKFAKPIITPTTKAAHGEHDENISAEEIIKRKLLTKQEWDQISAAALKLFDFGTKVCAKQGIILVDTKYEFGRAKDGSIVLIDEIHTPDSSRFWFADTYDKLFKAGEEQRKIDKEYVRKWYADQGYTGQTGQGKPPKLSDEVRAEAAKRYIQAYELITGREFKAEPGNITARVEKNLKDGGYFNG
jgi:phosphoribosylaminoimidazole-succinocarboxamide synthase